nr:uncharacterized protein LOC128690484 [Cherax quadricarinatus]
MEAQIQQLTETAITGQDRAPDVTKNTKRSFCNHTHTFISLSSLFQQFKSINLLLTTTVDDNTRYQTTRISEQRCMSHLHGCVVVGEHSSLSTWKNELNIQKKRLKI